MIHVSKKFDGFALPTILIASMVMLMVLVGAVSATTSVRSGLDEQYYTQLAREAAESGVARADGCLRDSAYVAEWSGNFLRPNTTCSGGNACTNTSSCFVVQRPTVRTTFTVGDPELAGDAQLVRAEGKVELLRSSNGTAWRTYTYIVSARVGAEVSFNKVAFGYGGTYGAYFATLASDGVVRGVGAGTRGQLGNGQYTDTLTPTEFKLPGDEKASAVFTNFLSVGYSMFVITENGALYGAGANTWGQLGNGAMAGSVANPVQFGLPGGVKAKTVSFNAGATYVLGDDNNIYSSGSCEFGHLGYTYTISGCANKSTYQRVALPPVNLSNLNTLPTTEIVTDAQTVYVRMQGGSVYGWGRNATGQLMRNSYADTSTPVQIGSYGNVGQPKALQLATDGQSAYFLDDAGDLKDGGQNPYGQLGGEKIPVTIVSNGKCLDNTSGNGVSVGLLACTGGVNQQWTFQNDGSLYHPASAKCLDNTNGDGASLALALCNVISANQRFTLRDDNTLYLPSETRCVNTANGTALNLAVCTTATSQRIKLDNVNDQVVRFNIPASSGLAVKVSTDQWFTSVLTSAGEVWSAGLNNRGQLGNGATSLNQPAPVEFILPIGVTAKDVYSASYLPTSSADYTNTFVIGSDGKVYGAGSNTFGQLGDGTTTARSTPVAMQVINGTTVRAKQVVSGYGTTVVLTEDGKIYTVGSNANGQLGDGTTTNSLVPKANQYTNVLPVTVF